MMILLPEEKCIGEIQERVKNSALQNHGVLRLLGMMEELEGLRPFIRPPLEHGWNWQSKTGSKQPQGDDNMIKDEITEESPVKKDSVDEREEEGFDAMEDTDDDLMSDDYDSASEKSHETRKKSKWFKVFFENLDSLSIEKINEAKGDGTVRLVVVVLVLLIEALCSNSSGEVFGKWKGLKDEEKDHEIVWPPMWLGMGNQELLNYFSTYDAVKARHSYGPQGHRGLSVLIFEASAIGYLEAERLHKHFAEQGTHRDAWFSHYRRLFLPGGRRQLYGYMAVKEDLDIFNRHGQGKSRLKYEMRSYKEMVVNQLRQMSEDNQLLVYLKDRDVKKQKQTKALEESLDIVTQKLRRTMEENRIVRLRTKMQHEENKEEMYMQEQFFKDQIRIIHDSRAAKEEEFERMQQEKREKVKPSSSSPSNEEEGRVNFQDKEMENFVGEEEKLREAHKDNVAAMTRRHWEEKVELEESFNEGLSKLMAKYSLSHPQTKFNGI
ncbi:hypothetical protein ACSQ67_004830 [Phaseolus vulgaris]